MIRYRKLLRSLSCDTIVLNSQASTEDKRNASNDIFCVEIEHVFDHFPNYHLNIILEYFNAKFGDRIFLKLKIGHEILHENTNAKSARVASFAI
jgi:hypothetical protein